MAGAPGHASDSAVRDEGSGSIDDLIRSLEAAISPNAELDGRIYCAINGLKFKSVSKSGAIHFEPDRQGTHSMMTPHPYTSSIDMALELVPNGKYWMTGSGKNTANEKLYGALVMEDNLTLRELGEGKTDTNTAIALCIAALRARATMSTAHGTETCAVEASKPI